MSLVIDACSALTNGFFGWEKREVEKATQRKISKREKVNAYGAVRKAAISTKAYINSSTPSDEIERELAEHWQSVANMIHEYDHILFEISNVKALGWATKDQWEELAKTVSTIKLDEIIEQCSFKMKELQKGSQNA